MDLNQYRKSDKTPSVIYIDPESLPKKTKECKNNFTKLSTAQLGEHKLCEYTMFTIWTFDGIENPHDVYIREN